MKKCTRCHRRFELEQKEYENEELCKHCNQLDDPGSKFRKSIYD